MNKRFFLFDQLLWDAMKMQKKPFKSGAETNNSYFHHLLETSFFYVKKRQKYEFTNCVLWYNILHVFSIREKLVKCPHLSFFGRQNNFYYLFFCLFFWLSCTSTHIFGLNLIYSKNVVPLSMKTYFIKNETSHASAC